jgi:glycosyltransferase involved in cell wall biosynthesis
MKVLFLSTSERNGGAAIAADRLCSALRKAGIEASMLVRDKDTGNSDVDSIQVSWLSRKVNFFRFAWERLIIFLANRYNRKKLFQVSIANTGTDVSEHPLVKEADIIHLHWINQGFLSLADIRKLTGAGKPVVWTMHDMWPCTGICHHAWGCEKFENTCGECPFLGSRKKHDLSYRTQKKKQFLSRSTVQIVTVSSWLKRMAEKSALTRELCITTIPNIVDTSVFFPVDNKPAIREQFSFPRTKKIVLMGAAKINDPIKGFGYLEQALGLLKEKRDDIFLVLFGEIKNDSSFLSAIPVEFASMGRLSDVSIIARLYAAADVTVVPSSYETFGQTLIESMACGCPVVSFDNSGQTDIIEHKRNGYLAIFQDVNDLATGIEWVLENTEKLNLSDACVKKVKENYSESVVADEYIKLYADLLNNNESLWQKQY